MGETERPNGHPKTPPVTAVTADAANNPALSSAVIIGVGSAIDADQRIGPYRILEKLGEGGMGVVFLAEQTEPVRRKVALKVIKPGMDSGAVIARFEAERQALALMDHPNIAKVFDAGATRDGRPYFVMEYVRGVAVTTHADRQRLSIEDRLELFMQVCSAVQHAHQKGIIHRDLKPGNILVAYDQNSTHVKIIDFGVAKAVNQPAVEAAAFTRFGHLIGTPEYMSPEQAEETAQDIDTRTDVYSLGVVLYELLAGTLPFDPTSLRSAALHEIHRQIREVDPPKPSTKVSSVGHEAQSTLDGISKARRSDPRSLSKRLRGDLDWIVMKCLEKDRTRRYDSAAAISEDLRRYLRHEPVVAGPPSAGYRAKKYIHRHRVGVIAAGLVAAALVIGLGMAAWQWKRAEAALTVAQASEARARAIAKSLINEYHQRVVPLPGSSTVRDAFVREGVSLLQDMNPGNDPATMIDIAEGYDRIGEVQAGLRSAHTGDMEGALAQYDRALALRTSALAQLGAPTPRTLLGQAHGALNRGDILREQEKVKESIAMYREGLGALGKIPSPDDKAEPAVRERALLQVALANVLARAGDPDKEREGLLTATIQDLGPVVAASPTRDTRWALARAQTNLGEYYLADGDDPARALEVLATAKSIWQAILADQPADSLVRHDLAGSLYWQGTALYRLQRTEEAVAVWIEAARNYGFLREADPTDRRAALGVASIHEVVGGVLRKSDTAGAAQQYAQAVQTLEPLARVSPGDMRVARTLGLCQYMFARTTMELEVPDPAAAVASAAAAFRTVERIDLSAPGDESGVRKRMVDAAQVWLAALGTIKGDPPPGCERAVVIRLMADTLERWSAEPAPGTPDLRSESKTLLRLRDLAGKAAEAEKEADPTGAPPASGP